MIPKRVEVKGPLLGETDHTWGVVSNFKTSYR